MRQLLISLPDQHPSTPDQQPNTWLDWHKVRNLLTNDEDFDCDDLAIIAARVPPARSRAVPRVAPSATLRRVLLNRPCAKVPPARCLRCHGVRAAWLLEQWLQGVLSPAYLCITGSGYAAVGVKSCLCVCLHTVYCLYYL